MRLNNMRESNNDLIHGKVLGVYTSFLKSKGWDIERYDANRISGTGFAEYKNPELGELTIQWRKRDAGFPRVIWIHNGGGKGVGKLELAKYLKGLKNPSNDLKENASAGATSAGAISTNIQSGGTPPKGQFFGGDPASSIYTSIKKHRKQRKENISKEVAEAMTVKAPKKPSGKSEIIGTTKPYKQPNVLGPKTKVKSTGKMLGGPEKKNPTLSTKFFGTCSANNDPGNKSIIAELTYKEFRNASNAVTKTCPACEGTFKNIHDVNQQFCSQGCEGKGKQLLKLKEKWEHPSRTEFITKDGKQVVGLDTVVAVVKNVLDTSSMNKFEAARFVAGMFKNCTGWDIVFAIDDYAKQKADGMYMLDKLES